MIELAPFGRTLGVWWQQIVGAGPCACPCPVGTTGILFAIMHRLMLPMWAATGGRPYNRCTPIAWEAA